MVVNPTWGVPRSIIVKEYLPLLQRNPNALGHLQVIDRAGPGGAARSVNFAAYNARNFPFALRQPPSDGNALGKVKFMFPNPYNIYLHDTPSASRCSTRKCAPTAMAASGSARPFDLAYALLSRQSRRSQGAVQVLSGRRARDHGLNLDQPVPVHLVYFTAWPTEQGRIGYRRDIYGRDAAIFRALARPGWWCRAFRAEALSGG